MNETYWTKGVHLFYEFNIVDVDECEENLFCTYINTIYGSNQTFSIMGEFNHDKNFINFQGTVPDATLAFPFHFTDVHLNLPLNFENDENLNFELNGRYALNVEKNKTINFQGSLIISNDFVIISNSIK